MAVEVRRTGKKALCPGYGDVRSKRTGISQVVAHVNAHSGDTTVEGPEFLTMINV